MPICRALLKHGYSNFSLEILEYCKPYKCLEREDYYLKLLNPEYNAALDPTETMSGRKHSDESRKKISDAKTGENNHMFGKNHSDETLKKLSDTKKGENNPMFGKKHTDETRKKISDAILGQARPIGSGRASQQIIVFDNKTNQTITYNSICEAAIALNIKQSRISMYFANNQQKPYKGQYTFALKKL
jgi:group I intron endonuclease